MICLKGIFGRLRSVIDWECGKEKVSTDSNLERRSVNWWSPPKYKSWFSGKEETYTLGILLW